MFVTAMELTDGASYETASVKLPTTIAAVIATVCVILTPCAYLDMTDVSDTQSVASHAVPPSRMRRDTLLIAKFAPEIVVLTWPLVRLLVNVFATRSVGILYDHDSVVLPICSPAVTATVSVLLAPLGMLAEIDVSDSQMVLSALVCPNLAVGEYDVVAKFAPMTLTKGVSAKLRGGKFPGMTNCIDGGKYEKASVNVAMFRLPVTAMVCVRPTPCATLSFREESDAHTVLSVAEPPIRAAGE
jgi:hypothetical protein